jgi:hypothetical protein
VSGEADAGGLVGFSTNLTINSSYNSANVTSETGNAGGLLGGGSAIIINDSYNLSSATIQSINLEAGGLIGNWSSWYASGSNIILNSYNQGPITGYSKAGGLVGNGEYLDNGIIKNSMNSGNVTTELGINSEENYSAGGIAGKFSGTIQNSYNTGAITGDHYAGGILGDSAAAVYPVILEGTYNTGTIIGGVHDYEGCEYFQGYCNYDEATCNSQNSCYWVIDESAYCGGDFLTHCSNAGIDQDSCEEISGCAWGGESCSNTIDCSNQGEETCGNYGEVCSWIDSSVCDFSCSSAISYEECANLTLCSYIGTVYGAAGGIAGNLNSWWVPSKMNYSFNIGAVSGGPYLGGLVGDLAGGEVLSSYWDTLSGQTNCYLGGDTGCTSTTSNASYYYDSANPPLSSWTWGNDGNWTTRAGNYPILTWQVE